MIFYNQADFEQNVTHFFVIRIVNSPPLIFYRIKFIFIEEYMIHEKHTDSRKIFTSRFLEISKKSKDVLQVFQFQPRSLFLSKPSLRFTFQCS